MPDAVTLTTPQCAPDPAPRPWTAPRLAELPKLTALTLASAIGGGGGTGGGGSTVFGILLALLSLSACVTERGGGPTEGSTPPVLSQSISCHADVAKGIVDCAGPSGVDREILGGQGNLIALRSSNVTYVGTTFSFDVTVQNLTSQVIGFDEFVMDSVSVFFESGPTPVGPGSVITVVNESAEGTFTAPNQPYFNYDSISAGKTSAPRNWQLNVPGDVTSFEFTVQVAARFPDFSGVLRWTQVPEFMDLSVDSITDIAVNSANDAMAVGDNGRVLRKVGSQWRQLPVQVTDDWVGIEAIGGGKYLGATSDTVYLFDGRVWKALYAPGFPILSVGGSAADRIIVGGFEKIHWLGSGGWESATVSGRTFKWVAALGSVQAVAVATLSGVVKLNLNEDTTTSSVSDGFTHTAFHSDFAGHFGFGAQNGGVPPAYIKEDPSSFIYGPKNDTIVDAVDFGVGASERWAVMRSVTSGVSVLRHRVGSTWTTFATLPGRVIRMTQDSAGGVYLLSADGIRQWNGSSVVNVLVASDSLTAVWGDDATAFVGTLSGAVWRYAGGSWTNTGTPTGEPIRDVQGFSATSAVVFDTMGAYFQYNGSGWSSVTTFGGVTDLWAASPLDVVVVQYFPFSGGITEIKHGDPMVLSFDVDPDGVNSPLNAVWATSTSDFWLVGNGGHVLHYSGGGYTAHNTFTPENLLAVHGTSNSDLWVSGTNGFFAHWDGASWTEYTGFAPGAISAVWAPRPNWVYLSFGVGQFRVVDLLGTFNQVTLPSAQGDVTAMSGVSANSVWAIVGKSLYRGTR